MKSPIILFFIFVSTNLFAQNLIVIESSKAYLNNKQKLKEGDTISVFNKIKVNPNGKILFNYKNRWNFSLTEGEYQLDSVFQKNKIDNRVHDSICSILESNNIKDCKFTYRLYCGMASEEDKRNSGHIIVENKRIETANDTLTIHWKHPLVYKGKYFIVLRDLADDYLEIKSTYENEINLNLLPLKKEQNLLVRIISEECRESEDFVIIME